MTIDEPSVERSSFTPPFVPETPEITTSTASGSILRQYVLPGLGCIGIGIAGIANRFPRHHMTAETLLPFIGRGTLDGLALGSLVLVAKELSNHRKK